MKDSDIKRRDFLKSAGICSTGLVLGAYDAFANSRKNQNCQILTRPSAKLFINANRMLMNIYMTKKNV